MTDAQTMEQLDNPVWAALTVENKASPREGLLPGGIHPTSCLLQQWLTGTASAPLPAIADDADDIAALAIEATEALGHAARWALIAFAGGKGCD